MQPKSSSQNYIADLIAKLTGGGQPDATPSAGLIPQSQQQGGGMLPGQNPLAQMSMPQLMMELTQPQQGKYSPLTKSEMPAHTPAGSASTNFTNNQYPVEATAFGQAIASGADPAVLASMS